MSDAGTDARFWDRIARKYARDPIKDLDGYERTLAMTADLLRATDSVLELACGTGTTALRLAPGVSRIVATDISSEMIAIAREKAAADGVGNVTFTVATPTSNTWADGAFDAALAFNVLHLLPDLGAALGEIRRTLKPGGIFVSKTPCIGEMNPLIRLAIPAMRLFGKAPSHVGTFDAADLAAAIAAAGFRVQTSVRHGSGRTDPRIVIVARKPGDHT